MRYPDANRLPLNSSVLGNRFQPAAPDPDSGEAGCWLLFCGEALVLGSASGQASALFQGLPDDLGVPCRTMRMGTWDGRPLRIAEIGRQPLPSGYRAEPLLHFFARGALADDILTLAGRAQQILGWERNSKACPHCGGRPERIAGTWGKRCTACGYERFPPIAPCALVLVRRVDELLLVRKREWPQGYYSLPSGFCDFAESLEECACREVLEETGIRITDLCYAGSQSWPFPSQLMVGFTAQYAAGELSIDHDELEHAAWFALDALPLTFSARSIAGWLIQGERARRLGQSFS